MTSMTERRARMLLRGSMLGAFVLSALSLAFGLHWLTLRRELTLPLAGCVAAGELVHLSVSPMATQATTTPLS